MKHRTGAALVLGVALIALVLVLIYEVVRDPGPPSDNVQIAEISATGLAIVGVSYALVGVLRDGD